MHFAAVCGHLRLALGNEDLPGCCRPSKDEACACFYKQPYFLCLIPLLHGRKYLYRPGKTQELVCELLNLTFSLPLWPET